MTCQVTNYIYIYKGDDTNWNNEQFVTINLTPATGSEIDLSGMTAKFSLGSYTQTYPLTTGSFEIDLNAATTDVYAYGPINGTLQIYDQQGRVKTVANTLPFYITNDVIAAQNQSLDIAVPEGSEVAINVTVGGTVSYDSLTDKPAINDVTIEGNQNADYYGLATTAGLSQKVSKSGDSMSGNLVMEQGTQITMADGALKSDDGMLGLEGSNYWLRVDTTSGLGAAIKSTKGVGDVLTALDVKSTYSASGMDPVNGQAVASAISGKQDTITGGASTITQNNLTANKALISNANGKVAVSNTTATELGYVSGVTSAIQTQINNEVNARTNADNDLQGQIDALSVAKDVVDFVPTYDDLLNYDTSKLKDHDIIKVLQDRTHDGAISYYEWSTSTHSFTYRGSEGPYYTKAEADAEFLSQSDAATTYLTQANAANTYETQANATASLALKASNADGTTIVDNGTNITTVAVKEQRAGTAIKGWTGQTAQLPATKDSNTIYVVTDEDDVQPIIVDSELSPTSTNPVQNKVIYDALQNAGGGLPEGAVYVPAVLPNFELFNSQDPTGYMAQDNPKIGKHQEAYDFTGTTNVVSVNPVASANNLTSFDIVLPCMLTTNSSGTDGLIGMYGANGTTATLRITVTSTGQLRLRVNPDLTTTFLIDITSANSVLTVNQKTYVKLSYSSTAGYKVLTGPDMDSLTECISSNVTTAPNNTCDTLFYGRNGTSYFKGVIYLRETYADVNGQRAFDAVYVGKVPMIMD